MIQNAGYNSTIAPGQSVSFGFLGSPGGARSRRRTYVVNGTREQHAPPPPPPSSAPSATVAFADVNDWGTGFTGNLTITNTGTFADHRLDARVRFRGNDQLDLEREHREPVRQSLRDPGCRLQRVIAAGQSVTIGFNASPGQPASGPTNYVLNGVDFLSCLKQTPTSRGATRSAVGHRPSRVPAFSLSAVTSCDIVVDVDNRMWHRA